MEHKGFTYPFCYVPHERVVAAAQELIDYLDGFDSAQNSAIGNALYPRSPHTPAGDFSGLGGSFPAALREGKMLGVLITDNGPLYAFSGILCGQACVPGFVPPIFDWTVPDGYFRKREAEISSMTAGPAKSFASAELQDWLFRQYNVLDARGEEMTIKEIFSSRGLVPPGGTGDCAAPKLLQYAYRHKLKPIAMGEFWYGKSPGGEVRQQGCFYPSCMGKCGPLLTYMMEGLEMEDNPLDKDYPIDGKIEILYEDEHIVVVDKPAGMLSVPGKGKRVSLLERLAEKYGEIHSCHRLDMDTSGVMVFARCVEDKGALEAQFASREVVKTYRARLCRAKGPWAHSPSGTIALPLALDYYDRPRQMVDREHGKMSVTRYEVLEMLPDGEIEIRFTPLTGRTHQIRVHAAHEAGLGRPIKGDRLYGSPSATRLFLNAESISFIHPATGKRLKFESKGYNK